MKHQSWFCSAFCWKISNSLRNCDAVCIFLMFTFYLPKAIQIPSVSEPGIKPSTAALQACVTLSPALKLMDRSFSKCHNREKGGCSSFILIFFSGKTRKNYWKYPWERLVLFIWAAMKVGRTRVLYKPQVWDPRFKTCACCSSVDVQIGLLAFICSVSSLSSAVLEDNFIPPWLGFRLICKLKKVAPKRVKLRFGDFGGIFVQL